VKFIAQFDEFLEKKVNLSDGRLRTLESKVTTIEDLLRDSDDDDLAVVEARPQGSLAQKTIINPVNPQRGFDADLLVELEDTGLGPKELLKAVKDVLKASPAHADLVKTKTRCVTLEYAGDFHIDVVPCVRQLDIPYIANRLTDEWEPTDPVGFTAWMDEHDQRANGFLVPAIRLCKYLRDYKGRPKIKSVILTILLAEMVDRHGAEEFTDLPTTLVLLLESLAEWCSHFPNAPQRAEPTCGAELRLGDTNWDAFTNQITSLGRRGREALDEPTEATSLARWVALFGSNFPSPAPDARTSAVQLEAGEEDLYLNFGIPTEITDAVSIEASVRKKEGFRHGSIGPLLPLAKSRGIDFKIATTVEYPYDVYWKVKNRGEEAKSRNGLRGEIRRDDNAHSPHRYESTSYTGSHYVEVYVVKEGVCVAKARQDVVIK
jgi:hypothetical protein